MITDIKYSDNSIISSNNIDKEDREKKEKTIEENKKSILAILEEKKDKISFHKLCMLEVYHSTNKKYNRCSLAILIFASIITFIEALKLSIYMERYKINNDENETHDIDNTNYKKDHTMYFNFGFIFNISNLMIGCIITLVSGIIKFKNWQNKLEKLKSLEDKLANHLRKIDKCKMQVQLIIPTEQDSYDKIKDKIDEYDDKYDTGTMFALIKPDIVSKIRILQVERKLKLEIKLRELRNKDIANKMAEEYKSTKTILYAKINKGKMLEEGRNKIDKINYINI
tara:strand:+ start:4110 stop:4958 length:849 start_codon:yes stop_codon:yes gene_type:complete